MTMRSTLGNRYVLEEFTIWSREIKQKYEKSNYEFFESQFRERNNIAKHIPNFWLAVISNHPVISAISDCGQDVLLQFVNDLRVEEFNAMRVDGFRVHFHFDPNPFFEDKVLTKEFITLANGQKFTTNSEIRWNPMLEGTELQAAQEQYSETRSFLGWFTQNDEFCVGIAERIRSDLWVNAFSYYMMSHHGDTVGSRGNRELDKPIVTAAPIGPDENGRVPKVWTVKRAREDLRRSKRLNSNNARNP